ncbi:zinc-dependent metalloprotease [Rapidithrix thailandica]|uniref:Zinc-dependent metalloprotease n=1 Tax=Rapidithrix thailandica TaxID=413964 RepID=A0AAW9SAS9_9BACT
MAQNAIGCVTDQAMETFYRLHPDVQQHRKTRYKVQKKQLDGWNNNYIIPVVFHINDPEDPHKVTMEQIQSAMEILNEDFNAANPDFSWIDPDFAPLAANVGIEFRLARFDPEGNPSTGVTYHTNNYTGREPDGLGSAIKKVAYWPGEHYLNIWICGEVEQKGVPNNSGWAFLPEDAVFEAGLDGIVYNWRYLGRPGVGCSETQGQAHMSRVLTHEVGHYLGLEHTFKGECDDRDGIPDTPPTKVQEACDKEHSPCGVKANVENYMDYSSCSKMFTNGQKYRMMEALNSVVAQRNSLWSPENLENTLGIGLQGAWLAFSSTFFRESLDNDGSIADSVIISLEGVGAFVENQGFLAEGIHFDLYHLSEGLNARAEVVNDTAVLLTLQGKAIHHINTDDVFNLKIEFYEQAFQEPTEVLNPVTDQLMINFYDPFQIVYQNILDVKVNASEAEEYAGFYLGVGNAEYAIRYNDFVKQFQIETHKKELACFPGSLKVEPLAYGEMIDGMRSFTTPKPYPDLHEVYSEAYPDWKGKKAYVGIRFNIGNEVHYGWLQVEISRTGQRMALLDYAYHEKPGEGLFAGQKEAGQVLSNGDKNKREALFSVYPNPGSGLYQLEVPVGERVLAYQVYDMRGKRLISQAWDFSILPEIDLRGFTGAAYVLEIVTRKGFVRKKILKY